MPKSLLWVLLAMPALWWAVAALQPDADVEALLRPTGEMSARLLIAALVVTPLVRLVPQWRGLIRYRRAIGVAAFGYGALHLVLYVVAMGSLEDMLAELGARGIWTGWLALALMLPLALTSSQAAMRALGRSWKMLQRLAYPAALLTLLHWVFVHDGLTSALLHFIPLALLEATRFLPAKRKFA